MNKEEKEKLLQQFLDGDLEASEEKEALHVIAEEPELREMLHFDKYLNQAFQQPEIEARSFSVPEDFSSQVMKAIEQREEQAELASERTESKGFVEKLKNALDTLLQPRTVQWKPAYGLAAVLVLIALTLTLDLGTITQSTNQNENNQQAVQTIDNQQPVQLASKTSNKANHVWARFFYVNKEANSVAVAGDFSNWEPIPLESKNVNGNKVWTGTVQMEKGEHRYMYIVNGNKWKTDPLASRYQEDGFGNRNAVITL